MIFFLLGLLTPILPMFGIGWLFLLGLLALSSAVKQGASLRYSYCFPLCIFIVTSSALVFASTQPFLFFTSLDPLARLRLLGQGLFPAREVNMQVWQGAHWLLCLGLLSVFSQSENTRLNFLRGVLVGAAVAACIGFIDFSQIFAFSLPNYSDFWAAQSRYAGSFTDPNAASVFLALLLPFWFLENQRSRYLCFLGAALTVGFGLVTGSRTFVLILLVYLLIIAWNYSRKLILAGAAAGVGLVVLATYVPTLCSGYGATLERVWATLSLGTMKGALFSRSAFIQAGAQMWFDHPLFGVGLGNFRFFVTDYAISAGVPLGLWTDNSNNFYLGWLAECGLLGLGLLCLTLSQLRLKNAISPAAKLSLSALLIALCTGPHLEFFEVAILGAFIVGSVFDVAYRKPAWHFQVTAFMGTAFAVGMYVQNPVQGLYAKEQTAAGVFRWTDASAHFKLPCNEGQAQLNFRAAHPDLADAPLHVKLKSGEHVQNFTLQDAAMQELSLHCPAGATKLTVWLQVDRTWQPSDFQVTSDSRRLGLQLWENS